MKLTVGRIVHAYPTLSTEPPVSECGWHGPWAAIVTHVGADFAKLRVFFNGPAEDMTVGVSLYEDDGHYSWRWCWPPRGS